MPRPYHFLFLSLLIFLPKSAIAQAPAAPTPQVGGAQTAVPLFRAQLPGGVYEVAIRSIVSVSSHEYLVDGVARVVEVNIDTTGSILARFYFIEPNAPAAPAGVGAVAVDKAQQLFTQAADKTGMDAWKKVVKNYPTTTHARTVEYRFQSREDLNKVFEAAEEAFRLQRPKTVKVD